MDVRFRSLLGSGNHANVLTATTGFESTKVALKKGEGASPFALDKDLSWMSHLVDGRHPITRPGAHFEISAIGGHADIVPAAFIFIARVVGDDVLAVNLRADLLDRFF